MTPALPEIWNSTKHFVQREAKLLMPLAMATLALGQMGGGYALQAMMAKEPGFAAPVAATISFLLVALGRTAIAAMVLLPRISVGEALRIGVSRLPRIVGLAFIVLVMAIILALPALFALTGNGAGAIDAAQLPVGVTLYMGLVLGIATYLEIRLFLFTPFLVDRDVSLTQSVSESIKLTHGRALQVFAILVFYTFVSMIVALLISMLVGSVFLTLGKAVGLPLLGELMVNLTGAMVSAAFGLVFTVFAALYYRAVSGTK